MQSGRIARVVLAGVLAVSALITPGATHGTASAAPCFDVEVIFARGSFEAPGLGPTGQKFVDRPAAQSSL